MSRNAIDSLDAVRIDAVHNPYLAERVRGQSRVDLDRLERARAYASVQAEQAASAPAPQASLQNLIDPNVNLNQFRDKYAEHNLSSAIEAFHKEQAALQARADAEHDLGTIQGVLPLQPYRIAVAAPPVVAQQIAAVVNNLKPEVMPVRNVDGLRNASDDALSSDATTRARTRRLRDSGR